MAERKAARERLPNRREKQQIFRLILRGIKNRQSCCAQPRWTILLGRTSIGPQTWKRNIKISQRRCVHRGFRFGIVLRRRNIYLEKWQCLHRRIFIGQKRRKRPLEIIQRRPFLGQLFKRSQKRLGKIHLEKRINLLRGVQGRHAKRCG